MVDVGELVVLQEANLRLDEIKKRLREIDGQLGEPPSAAALQSETDAQAAMYEEARRGRETADAEAEATREKIGSEEGKLYGGESNDPRELKNLQEEVYALRRMLKTQDETVLMRLEQEESAKEVCDYLARLSEQSKASWDERRAAILERRKLLDEDAATVQREVDEQRKLIDPGDLVVYDDQRSRQPLAVATAEGGVCGSCRLALPTNVLMKARRASEVVYCPACACIVHFR